ncbi:transcriptional regulator, AraC family [Methylobacillus rhizosphaerae]|uniref:Transcriptional regulator, AraC family n=1 Tax=Methylobacillus rhizosphaerae TaxID=551994 RepID=A0A238YDK0_9PROT|nr:AraC family transcriptional regulator [Methylobacillus rhizosphaerae]SNR69295.1 transcriptional regulator, AraC family [Methylobacillus rhizosphaerae]
MTRFIPAQHQAALLLEYASSRDLPVHALLQKTRLSEADVLAADTLISPAEYLQLLANLQSGLSASDTSFMLGQQLLPGHYGNLSHALLHARNLRQALDIFISFQSCLSPLLAPHLMEHKGQVILYWTESCVTPRLRSFIVEMMMTAISSMSRWLSGNRLPWSYRFNRTRPAHPEQYVVHLGNQLYFNEQMDSMCLPVEYLDHPWPHGSDMAVTTALASIRLQYRRSLLSTLYDYLSEHIRASPTLEQTSAVFGVSPATFKRHLVTHHTHFQAELDQARMHIAIQLIQGQDYSNDAVADYLGFHDANNFRRSLKRWTGLTPSMLRLQLPWG